MALVAFLDILGTKEQVLAEEFIPDVGSLDFSNAVGLAAYLLPKLRFAVFSDCVIVSADESDADLFIKALGHMYSNWHADWILVRGAVAVGEIDWVDDVSNDSMFKKLRNFMYARVYGRALVHAHQLEQRAGPGAICFLTEEAADFLEKTRPGAVLPGPVPCLVWATKQMASGIRDYMNSGLAREKKGSERRRHLLATQHFWQRVVTEERFLPDDFGHLPDSTAGTTERRSNLGEQLTPGSGRS